MISFIVPIVAAWDRIDGIHMHEMDGHKAGRHVFQHEKLGACLGGNRVLGFYRFGDDADVLGGGVTEYRA